MEKINKQEIALSAAIGVIGVILFLFLFPGKAIPTIMHDYLNLPGPGAGFGVVIGPFMIMSALAAYGLVKKYGAILTASTVFGVFLSFLILVFKIQIGNDGTVGSTGFAAGSVVIGVVLELMAYLLREKSRMLKYVVSAVIANLIFLAFSLLAIFSQVMPDKFAQLTLDKILIISGASVFGAVIIGGFLPLLVLRIIEFIKKAK